MRLKDATVRCMCCGIELNTFTVRNQEKLEVDQRIPGEGYTPENTGILCHRCNRIKNDGTVEDHERIILYMKGAIFASKKN